MSRNVSACRRELEERMEADRSVWANAKDEAAELFCIR
jgi:hypothetical protein